jgi:hypothetical protein
MLPSLPRASNFQHDQFDDIKMHFLGKENAFNMLPFPGRSDIGQPSYPMASTFQHDPALFHAQADFLHEDPTLQHKPLLDQASQLQVQSPFPSVALFQAIGSRFNTPLTEKKWITVGRELT